ncbi:MAG: tetratricopeptide repeat protein [Candidatus Saccharicenans sp.]|uniref:tetratricopeptide repeat protein n=1 Tax=Candidatus Saccharicenans sp. TaxID=2819258 RepID=UPI00404B330B
MIKKAGVILLLSLLLSACFPVHKAGSANDFDRHLQAGLVHMQKKDFARARQEFLLALNLNPKSTRILNLLGLTYFREQDYDLAEMYFLRAVKIDPEYNLGYLNLGGVYAMKQLYARAREYYERALNLDPGLTAAYYSLGAVCFQLGDEQAALKYLSRGLEQDPHFLEKHPESLAGLPMKGNSLAELYFSFARLYASREDVERTVEYLKKARQAGFKDWERIDQESEFEKIRDNPVIREFLK